MKKILLIIILLFPLSVFAIENVTYKDHNYYLCDETGTAYHLYEIKYNYEPLFPLNYTTILNFDFSSYEKEKYDNSPYLSSVQDYLWITPLVNHVSIYKYYYQIVIRFLWENLYPDKTFSFCNESTLSLQSKEEVYQTVKKRVENVLYGPEILKEIYYQESEEEYVYQDETFKFYYLSDDNGLDAYLEGDTLYVKGKSGNYKLIFKIKGNMSSNYDELYTDGNNYLALYPKQPNNEYVMNIIINSIPLNISFDDDILDENLCMDLYQNETFIEKSCVNNQNISFNLDKGEYVLKLLNNDYYEDLEEKIDLTKQMNISLKLKVKENNNVNEIADNNDSETFANKIDEDEDVKVNDAIKTNQNDIIYVNTDRNDTNTLTFKPKNTYQAMNLIFIFVLFSYYVIKQKK